MDRIKDNNMAKFEVCCNSFLSASNAEDAGADRIELCSNLQNGGTTPTFGLLKLCCQRISTPINVLIRPRGGDFLYSEDEFEEIKQEIQKCKIFHVNGIVCGILTADGNIDVKRTKELVELAHPMKFTFHRAFDLSRDPMHSLKDIIETGADHILTSGMAKTAYEGRKLIAELVKASGDKITILPGGGINESNIKALAKATHATEFHFSASKVTESKMTFRRENILGKAEDDYTLTYSDTDTIINIKKQLLSAK